VCGPIAVGFATCTAIRLNDPSTWQGRHVSRQQRSASASAPIAPKGYGPADLQSAYGLATASAKSGGHKTIAIVDAYDDPNAATDLAAYRSTEGLPALCGTPHTGKCVSSFTKVYAGGTAPPGNASWGVEISIDLDMVSAICPKCKIVLVETLTNSVTDMAGGNDVAARHKPVAISNSWGGNEFSGETAYDGIYFNHPGIAIVASSGDSGDRVFYPAASPDVTAVGGTSLINSGTPTSPKWSETVWSGSGSGCSAYETAPSWQFVTSTCSHRTVADVAAVADPLTGIACYDTYSVSPPGWSVCGGTSVAAPIIASVYALAGGGTTPSALYASAPALRPVKTGSNSGSCSTYLCNAADSLSGQYSYLGHSYDPPWYNGPTGNGTPQGTSSF